MFSWKSLHFDMSAIFHVTVLNSCYQHHINAQAYLGLCPEPG